MKVKKWLLGLITFTAMVVICAVCAGAQTYGDFEYDVLDDGTVEITGYNGNAEKVDIPAEIDGKSVTSIGKSAFQWCPNIKSITIPKSVTSICDYAFNDCTSLTSITIPSGVTEIGGRAFGGCTNLTSITLPDSVMEIGWGAFKDCISLTSITIPDSVTSIGSGVFSDCTSLTAIFVSNENKNYVSDNDVLFNKEKTELLCYPPRKEDKGYIIPDGVTSICDDAFSNCTSLTSIAIPSTVTNIGAYAFNNCTSLISITIPDGVTSIEYGAFGDCSSLTSITIPDSITSIGYEAFINCDNLLSITIPDSVTWIGDLAFCGCKSLVNVTIPNSVTSIGYGAFRSCTSFTSITIPESVIQIGYAAFSNCLNLTVVNVDIENKYYIAVDSVLFNKSKTSLECYPAGKPNKNYNIPDGVTWVSKSAFEGCAGLINIIIPNSVTNIGDDAFSWCVNLSNVTIAEGIEYIGRNAFMHCLSLKSVTIPQSAKSILTDAFGYYYDYDNDWYTRIKDFKIYCYSGTAGEKYAKDNKFEYELITAEKLANVTGFKVKSIFSTNVTLQWNKNANASGYEIEQYKGGKWVNVAKITGNATTSYTVKGLAAGTAGYKFRMRAVKNGAYSDYTSVLTVNTNPYGVGGFKCSSKSSTSVTLKWNKGTTASGYQLQQYKDGKWVTLYTGTKATDTSYTVKNLKAGTAGYRFRIRAHKTYGNTKQYGSWSSEVKVNTNPYGVGGFKAKSISSTSITLQWNKGTTASGYQLQQYKDGKWVTIYTGTKATNTSYTVKKLKAGTVGYRFRIRAYKTYGNTKQYGSWSSEVKVNTNPYGVGGFKAKSTAKNSITLGWNKGTTASGYQLQQYKGGKWVTVYTGTKATSTSYTAKSLKSNTSYKFRIRAYKTYGNTKQYGSWSKELTVRTKR